MGRVPTISEYRKIPPHPDRVEGGQRIKQDIIDRVERPTLSIITPVFNGEETLEKTIESVLAQKQADAEYVIVDGGSSDGTLEIIRGYEDEVDYWVSEPDYGIYDAMNRGVALTRGEVVGILNADDQYLPETLDQIADAVHAHSGASVYHGDLIRYWDSSEAKRVRGTRKIGVRSFCWGMPVNHPTAFVRRSAYEQLGLFDTSFKMAADAEFMLRCVLSGADFHYVPHDLAIMKVGGASKQHEPLGRQEVHEALQLHGVPLRYRFLSGFNVILKTLKITLYRLMENTVFAGLPLRLYRVLKNRWNDNRISASPKQAASDIIRNSI